MKKITQICSVFLLSILLVSCGQKNTPSSTNTGTTNTTQTETTTTKNSEEYTDITVVTNDKIGVSFEVPKDIKDIIMREEKSVIANKPASIFIGEFFAAVNGNELENGRGGYLPDEGRKITTKEAFEKYCESKQAEEYKTIVKCSYKTTPNGFSYIKTNMKVPAMGEVDTFDNILQYFVWNENSDFPILTLFDQYNNNNELSTKSSTFEQIINSIQKI